MFRNDRLYEKSGRDVNHRFVDWCSEILSLVRWLSSSWFFGAWGDYIWMRGWSYYCLLDYKWNRNVQNEHRFLLKKTWNKLTWKQFTEGTNRARCGLIFFFLHRLPYIRLLFETMCVASIWKLERMQVEDSCASASLCRPSGCLFALSIFTTCDRDTAQFSVWNFYLALLLDSGHDGTSDSIRLMVHFEI